MTLTDAWIRTKKDKDLLEEKKGYEIYEYSYWTFTQKIYTDLTAGEERAGKKNGDEEMKLKVKETFELNDNYKIMYTDGSKREGKPSVGSAIIEEGFNEGLCMSMHHRCSIFTAEMAALAKALKILLIQGEGRDVIIFSDSQSAIKALQNNDMDPYMNSYEVEARVNYSELNKKNYRENKKVVIAWCPAHQGVTGNEDADELAKLERRRNVQKN